MLLELLPALLIGLMVTMAMYIGLQKAFHDTFELSRRAIGIFAGAGGLLTTLWLMQNPQALESYSTQIITASVAVVLALLAVARRK